MKKWVKIHATRNRVEAQGMYHYLTEHEIPVRVMERPDSVYTIFQEIAIEVPEEHQTLAEFLLKSYLTTYE